MGFWPKKSDWHAAMPVGANVLTGGMYGQYLSVRNQEEASRMNLQLGKENLAWQKEVQNKIFAREDDAVQRSAADMQAAGLSKTLAAGRGAGAGAVVTTNAPKKEKVDYRMDPQVLMNMIKMKSDISLTNTQRVLNELQGKKVGHEIRMINAHEKAFLSQAGYNAEQGRGALHDRKFAERTDTRIKGQTGAIDKLIYQLNKEGALTDMMDAMRKNLFYESDRTKKRKRERGGK